ncbi:MAG: hypothetical protein JM58_16675 [Peptococcaceae bacterium BICA1-8]|nr:MAG: hypothetical protein JM58_16675 [Peptococcaceae bacterium BICA1-8]
MKFLDKNEELCTKCHLCEEVCAAAINKSDDREKSAIRIDDEKDIGIINVCNQCGECIEVCSEQAIFKAKNGVILINKSKCIGCLICVGYCPSLSMIFHEDIPAPFKCIACGKCTDECPSGAIFLKEIIDEEQVAAGVAE